MRRKFYWLLTLAVLYIGFRVASNQLLGFALQSAFSAGTGCAVRLSSPRLTFWPLMGTVQNVSIVSPKERADAGFRADEISVRLNLGGLFSKEILLDDLILHGARVDSVGTDTGFYNTLNFLFADRPKSSGGWAPFFSAWHIHIPEISIYGTDRRALLPATSSAPAARPPIPHLRLQHGPVNLVWDEVTVVFGEPHHDRSEPYNFRGAGSNFKLQLGTAPAIPVGQVFTDGRIGQGIVVFTKAQVEPPASNFAGAAAANGAAAGAAGVGAGPTNIAGTGTIYLGNRDEYDLSIDAEVGPDTVAALDPSSNGSLGEFRPMISLIGRMTGKLNDPHFFGPLRLANLPAVPAPAVPEARKPVCADAAITANLDINSKRVSLTNVGIDPDGTLGTAEIRFEEHFPYSVGMQATPQKIQTLRNRCRPAGEPEIEMLPAIKAGGKNGPAAMDLDIQGTIAPVSINGSIEANDYPIETLVSFVQLLTGKRPNLGPLTLTADTEFDAHGKFQIDPATAQSSGNLDIAARNALLLGTAMRNANTELRFDGDRVEVFSGAVQGDLGEIEIKGVIPFRDKINISGIIKNLSLHALPQVAATLPQISLTGSGTVDISGTVSDPETASLLALSATGIENNDKVWKSKVQLKTAAGRLSGSASMFADTATAQFDLPLDPASSEQMRIGVKAVKFPAGEIVSYFNTRNQSVAVDQVEVETDGELTGTLDLTAPRNDILAGGGQMAIQNLRLVENGIPITNIRPLTVLIQNGRAVISDFEIAAADKTARLTGYVDNKSGWNVIMAGAWDLESLIPAISGIEQMSGDVDAELAVRGPVSEPQLSGKFGIENGSISFPLGTNVYGIEQAKIEGTIDTDRISLTSLKGQFGDGLITGSGEVLQPFSSENRTLNAAVQFDNLQLEPADNLTVDLKGDLLLTQAGISPLTIGGEVDIKSAVYEDNIDLLQMIRIVTRYLTGSQSGTTRRSFGSGGSASAVILDLDIKSENTILIDTDIVQAELRSALKITGPIATPLVDGDLTVVDGQFGFKANQFEILIGKIQFSSQSGTTDPRLNILGETTLATRTQEEHRISLLIQGTLSNPAVTFSSDRGLSSSEIVGLLGIGSSIDRQDGKTRARTDRSIAELLNPISGVSMSDRVAGLTGLRNIRLETGVSPETGEVEPHVTATKPLVGKLILDLQSNLTGRTSAADVDYRLTPYLSLIAGWKSYSATDLRNSTGGFNIGLRYRDTFPGLRLFPRSLKQSRGSRRGE